MAPIFLALHLRTQSVALLPIRIALDLALYHHFWTREFNRWVIRDHAVAHSSQIAFRVSCTRRTTTRCQCR
jgi:hypothetical protein